MGADCAVTDTCVMGDRDNAATPVEAPQVNARLMAKARPDAIFMHCLPAPAARRSPTR